MEVPAETTQAVADKARELGRACSAVSATLTAKVAVTVYAYMRDGELRALTWDDVDLEHNSIHVHQSLERDTGKFVATKGMQNRRVPIEPSLRPLLEAMRKEVDGEGLVFAVYPVAEHTARSLRDWLRRAGVTRAELHRDSLTHKNITFHDLRASGLTWMAIRGDDPLKIQQRAGHADLNTTQGYIRTAEAVREGFGVPFPVLPVTLLFGAPGAANDHSIDHRELSVRNFVEAPGIEADLWQIENTMEHGSGTIGTDGDPADVSDRASKCPIARGVVTESSEAYELSNVVETALARALVLAAEAKRWDVVLQISGELHRRGSAQPTRFAPSERLKRSSKV